MKHSIRTLAALFVCVVVGLGMAAPVSALADTKSDAGVFVSSLAERAINGIGRAQIDDEERAKRLRVLLVENFDMAAIDRFVTGRFWKSASEGQQKEFARLFEDLLVYTWSKRFREYSGQSLEIVGSMVQDESGAWPVETRILDENKKPVINVTWRVRQEGNAFKAVDLVVEGVSMAVTQRSDILAVLQREGMDGLNAALREKVEGIRSGKIALPPVKTQTGQAK
jgi:phospholipid transport system substrate-binding protein